MSTEPHDHQHLHTAQFTFTCGEQTVTQTVEGTDKTVAAWLRAVADQIDPPRRPTRSATHPFRANARGHCETCGGGRYDSAHVGRPSSGAGGTKTSNEEQANG